MAAKFVSMSLVPKGNVVQEWDPVETALSILPAKKKSSFMSEIFLLTRRKKISNACLRSSEALLTVSCPPIVILERFEGFAS